MRKLFSLCFLTLSLFTFSSTNVWATDEGIESIRKMGEAFASIAKKVSPAVVFIKTEKQQAQNIQLFGNPFGQELFKHFFGPGGMSPHGFRSPRNGPSRKMQGQGSGFIISEDGIILTNNHVVGEADKVTVKLLDGREFTATILGTDPQSDVAVIKIDAYNLPTLELGDSAKLDVGNWVIAMGNPFGLSHTLTAGIVSAKGRNSVGITDYENFIQTDAAINPGNSGGPLISLEGKVVGINTAIFSQSGGYMGIGFAIPVNMVRKIKDQLIANGKVVRGWLGVAIQNLDSQLKKSFNVGSKSGILVSQVTPDSPASKAGFKRGDVILKLNDHEVEDVASFRNKIALTAPNTKVEIGILRDGKTKNLEVKIGTLAGEQVASIQTKDSGSDKIGLALSSLNSQAAKQLGVEETEGVLISSVLPGSPADESGIRAGMIILEVNRSEVNGPAQASKQLKKAAKSGDILLLVKFEGHTRYITVKT